MPIDKLKLQIPKASCSLQPLASSTFLINLPVPSNAAFCNNSTFNIDTYYFQVLFQIFRNYAKCTYYHRHNIRLGVPHSRNFSLEMLVLFNLSFTFSAIRASPSTEISTIKHWFPSLCRKTISSLLLCFS